MADQIVVLNEGRIEQVGPPIELYARPANLFVARFLGAPPMNLLTGRIARIGGLMGITLEDGTHIPLPGRQVDLPDGAPVTFGVRPEHCEIGQGSLEITVGDTEILGSETIIHAETATGNGFTVALRGISRAASGSRIPIVIREPFVHLFNEAGVTIGSDGDWRDAYLN